MTNEDFLKAQGDWFHIRLLKFYYLSLEATGQPENKDSDILYFTFKEGDYIISFLDLKLRADEETTQFLELHGLSLGSKKSYQAIDKVSNYPFPLPLPSKN